MSASFARCRSTIAERRARAIAPVQGGGRTALGPVGSGHAGATAGEAKFRAAHDTRSIAPAGAEIAAPSLDPKWQPQASFEQNFIVHHSLAKVWDFFGRIDEVATCLPGASIRNPRHSAPPAKFASSSARLRQSSVVSQRSSATSARIRAASKGPAAMRVPALRHAVISATGWLRSMKLPLAST